MIKSDKKIIVLFHFLAWAVLFCLPYLLSSGDDQLLSRVAAHSWVPLVFYAILFYINYLFLVSRFLFTGKTFWFILFNLIAIGLFIALRGEINMLFFEQVFKPMEEGKGPPPKMFLYVQMFSYMLPVMCAIALKTMENWQRTETERKEAANVKLQSELQHLRYQLQPHFFFNSLNNIYSLVDISPSQAKSTIHSLGKLMRYLLYETKSETVPLSKEIDFLQKYIDLMQLRISDSTSVKTNFPSSDTNLQVAPLLFISLIENAFKHGVSAQDDSEIDIRMDIKSNTIDFRVVNRNFPKSTSDKSGSGIGLQNLEKRLQLLYPSKHQLRKWVDEGMYRVELKVET